MIGLVVVFFFGMRFNAVALAATTTVTTPAQLTTALTNAKAGDVILLNDGTYSGRVFNITSKKGTAASPITIKAVHQDKAIISGTGTFSVKDSSYIVIQGLQFTNTGNSSILLYRSDHVRVTRNTFHQIENGTTSAIHWVYISGSTAGDNTIDRNLFENKKDPGNFISIAGSDTAVSQGNYIGYNYFRNIGPESGANLEAVRVGLSYTSLSNGNTTVEFNLFENCTGDDEVISVKSAANIVRFNTFRNNEGSLVGRNGNNNQFYGNFFLGGKGGIRTYGKNQLIFNNYFEGTTGTGSLSTVIIPNGDVEEIPAGVSNSYYARPENITVAFNTLVNNTTNITIGSSSTSSGSLEPNNLTIANNIVTASQNKLVKLLTPLSNIVWTGNIMYPTGTATVGIEADQSQIRIIDPQLIMLNTLQKLSSTSAAIDAASGSTWLVTQDMDGQDRIGIFDVGADEYSNQSIIKQPLTATMVGPTAP